ncbi:MAG TPA: hypothetical protein VMI54_04260 [Polyangiaceae bacterium]|nr:hypothetical protein [Polyangiaceae bacterium]
MHALKAHVHNGRLVLDEPTDLPEGDPKDGRPLLDGKRGRQLASIEKVIDLFGA